MRNILIFSIANRFGRTYSGSFVFQFVEFFNQVYCWDANSIVLIMFWFIEGHCMHCAMQSFNSILLVGWCTAVRRCIEPQQFDRAFDKCRHHRSAQSPLLKLCELIPMKSSSRLHFANDAERPRCDSATAMQPRQCDRDATAIHSWSCIDANAQLAFTDLWPDQTEKYSTKQKNTGKIQDDTDRIHAKNMKDTDKIHTNTNMYVWACI